MFRIISEVNAESTAVLDDDRPLAVADRFVVEEVPYVEIGGPDGLITSIPKPVIVRVPPTIIPVAVNEPEVEETVEPEVAPASDARVLSVSFHRYPKSGLRLLSTGVVTDLIVYHQPDHPVSVEYRAVRDEIRRQFEEPGPRAVLFTAATPTAGTTTVLLNCAASLAQESQSKVLIVDAHFARPAVARRLGIADSPGLAEVLGQTVPLAWALQPTPVANLHTLSAGHHTEGTDAALATDFTRLMTQLRQWFDWVLVDAGVWSHAAGKDGIAPASDAVFLVTRQSEIDRPEFGAMRASVAASGGLLRGYVTTRH